MTRLFVSLVESYVSKLKLSTLDIRDQIRTNDDKVLLPNSENRQRWSKA